MYNIKYLYFNIRKGLVSTILVIIQMTIITLVIAQVGVVVLNNYAIKNQFKNFDLNNMYSVSMISDFYEANMSSNFDFYKINNLIEDNAITVSTRASVNYNEQNINALLTSNFDTYNHKYAEKENSEDKLSVVVGSSYQDKVDIGQTYELDYTYGTKNKSQKIELDAVISGVLEPDQYYFNAANAIEKTDNTIFIDYHSIYNMLDDDLKPSFLQEILRSSFFYNSTNLSSIDYMNDIEEKLDSSGLKYQVMPYKESKKEVYLILKTQYDTALFQFIIVMAISIIILINYLKYVYVRRRKMYSLFILYGYSIKDIIIQLLLEIIFILVIDFLIVAIATKGAINYKLLIFIILIKFLFLSILVLSLQLQDNKIVMLIKE